MAKSAIRRHHWKRLKNKRKKYWGREGKYNPPLTQKQLNMVSRTPKWCGCVLCSSHKRRECGRKTFNEVKCTARVRFELNNLKGNYDET